MEINEICYRLQAMATMCIFKDAVGHDLSHKEIELYNQAKDEAIKIIKYHGKHAMWRYDPLMGQAFCSECKFYMNTNPESFVMLIADGVKYCPGCGAKMDLEE